MARRSRLVVARGARRTTTWLGANAGSTAIAGSSLTLISTLGSSAKALRPFTIVRVRLLLHYATDQTANSEQPFGQFGMIVVNEKAAALGITGVPTPATDIDDDWHVHQSCTDQIMVSSAVGLPLVGRQYTVDSKAMRKVDVGDDCAMVFEQGASVGATIVVQGRMLIKLH